MTTATLERTDESNRLGRAQIVLALVTLAGLVAGFLDTTIVNVAIDTLGRELHSSVSAVQWVSTAYLLVFAVVIPMSGWLVGRIGAKRAWLGALSVFLIGSVLCGVAWNIASLVVFRVVQGVGGGLLLPVAQTLLVRSAGPDRLGRIMAFVAVPAQLAPILGPVVGGAILSDLSWRWIFYVNVPVCLLALALAMRFLPDAGERRRDRLDRLGLLLLSPALAAVIYAVSRVGQQGGFAHPEVLVPLLVAVALFAAYARHALHTSRTPVVDLRLFRHRTFSAASALMALFGVSIFGAMFLLPLFYQQARGASVLSAGLLLIPQGVGTMVATLVVGRLTDRIGPRPVVIGGMIVASLGTLPFALAGAHTSGWLLGAALVLRGAGLGAAGVPVMAASYYGLRPDEIPHATSASRIMQQVGGAIGTAVLAVVLERLAAGATDPAAAFRGAFWWSLGFSAVALVPAALLPRRR